MSNFTAAFITFVALNLFGLFTMYKSKEVNEALQRELLKDRIELERANYEARASNQRARLEDLRGSRNNIESGRHFRGERPNGPELSSKLGGHNRKTRKTEGRFKESKRRRKSNDEKSNKKGKG